MNWRDEGIELDTQMKQFLLELAKALSDLREYDDAATLLVGLQHLVVYREVPLGQLAAIQADRRLWPEALSTIDRALGYNPESIRNHTLRAEILFGMGDAERAHDALRSARRLGQGTAEDMAYLDGVILDIDARGERTEGVQS